MVFIPDDLSGGVFLLDIFSGELLCLKLPLGHVYGVRKYGDAFCYYILQDGRERLTTG